MNPYRSYPFRVLLVLCLTVALSACGGSPTPVPETPTRAATSPAPETRATETPTTTPTPTATPVPQQPATPTPTATPTDAPLPEKATETPPPASRCEGLAGQFEVQVLVGPADAAGLEPEAVGSVPFAVTTPAPPYLVEGQGPISYQGTLVKEWGTYDVTMDLDVDVQGECLGGQGSEQLDVTMEATGEQLVVVDSPSFQGEYPWSGTQILDLSFPLEEGATAQGEGWVVVLHLASP